MLPTLPLEGPAPPHDGSPSRRNVLLGLFWTCRCGPPAVNPEAIVTVASISESSCAALLVHVIAKTGFRTRPGCLISWWESSLRGLCCYRRGRKRQMADQSQERRKNAKACVEHVQSSMQRRMWLARRQHDLTGDEPLCACCDLRILKLKRTN